MKKLSKGSAREYHFKIDAYSPDTMPLLVLADYLRDLSDVLGEQSSTHLIRVDQGSTDLVLLVDREAEPKIQKRAKEIESGDAPQTAIEASYRLNARLGSDAAKAAFISPIGHNLLVFPGVEKEAFSYGPFNQNGSFDGIPVMVGGTKDNVSVHLEGRRDEKYNCQASRGLAKQIAPHLFTTIIRVRGVGRWIRHPEGRWEMRSFKIDQFEPLGNVADISLKKSIEEIRAIPAKWKEIDDPVGELMRIRYGKEV